MPPRTALVLDDNRVLRNLLTEFLEEKGYQVVSYPDPCLFLDAYGGKVEAADIDCFELILTDNMMPCMNGLDFLDKIKCIGCQIPDRHKAVISGNWSNEDLERARQAGYRIFHKPCHIDDIHGWIDEIRKSA